MPICRNGIDQREVIVDVEGGEIEEWAFKNLPKLTSDIKRELSAAGFTGSLCDADGCILCGRDQVDETQVYRLVPPAPLLGMHFGTTIGPGRSGNSCCSCP